VIRTLAIALIIGSTTGCIEDRCELDGSVRLLFVYPDDGQATDTTNPHVFYSIQDALDASPPPEGDEVETTICVADGVYREQLNIPSGVRLLGRGVDRVRLRPPGGRDDETLVRVTTDALTTAAIQDVDIGGTTGACIEASGGGTLQVITSRLLGCGTAIRASGGGDVGAVEVRATPIARSGTALDITSLGDLLIHQTDITGNTTVATVDNSAGGGAVRFVSVRLSDNGTGLAVTGGSVEFTAVKADEDHSLVVATDASVRLRSTATSGGPIVILENATLVASHLTVLGAGPLLSLEGGSAVITNSILEPETTGDGDIDVRSSMTGDPAAPTTGANVPWEDPKLTAFAPASSSPVRCEGEAVTDDPIDLLGNPRPYRDGKAPDLGAVELQEDCP
jgi:hypothetical protein